MEKRHHIIQFGENKSSKYSSFNIIIGEGNNIDGSNNIIIGQNITCKGNNNIIIKNNYDHIGDNETITENITQETILIITKLYYERLGFPITEEV